ncbi:MAG: S8 family serine peptidase [Lachnospiraceae bacterium]|nr:S8 family serine peptidase [Lachnospiraceae bacterium]
MHKRVLSLLAAAIGLFLCAGCMYVPVSQAEGLTGSGAGPAAQTEVQEIQAEEPEAQAAGSVAEQPEAQAAADSGDYTYLQYNADGPFGIDVDGWNTYDAEGKPVPVVDTSDIVVAVVDSGVDYTHPDLKNVMWDEGLDYPELVAMGGGKYGINVSPCDTHGIPYDTTDPMDDYHHGTHVAGIIAAEWNGAGISGITGGAKIMAVKCMNNNGTNSIVESIRAYEYIIAAKKAGVNVKVINNSWHDAVFGQTMDKLVREAGELGIISVFAAGNRALEIDNKDILQASFYNNPYVVIVGASDEEGKPTEFTNTSRRIVDVFAPGNKIYSTIPRLKGDIPDNAQPYEKDGRVFFSDYSLDDVTIDNNHVNSVLGFSGSAGDNSTTLTLEEHPEAGRVLRLEQDEEYGSISIDSDTFEGTEECVGGVLELYLEEPAPSVIVEVFATDIETEQGAASVLNDCPAGPCRIPFNFYDGRGASKRSFRLTIYVSKEDYEQADHVYLKSMSLTADVDAYGYDTGTSMATPAVSGEAAILSAAYPEEGADRIAARIIGSAKPADGLADISMTGGIASVRKALQDTPAPVVNAVKARESLGDEGCKELAVSGYFFGDEAGGVSIDGMSCIVKDWNDTAVMLEVPEGLAAGEHLIEVTAAGGGAGRRYDRIGTPETLFERLPLPGRELVKTPGTPGTYRVTSDEFDNTFYGIEMRSLIGFDGALYAFCNNRALQTSVFRYDIGTGEWSEVYNGGYSADSGVCTWKGKILFFANDEYDAKAYLGVFDPADCTAEYYLLNDESCENGKSMVNNGTGVYVVGGNYYHLGPIDRFTDIMSVRKLDEDSMTLVELERTGDDQGFLMGQDRCLVYDGPDTLYVFGGNDSENDLNDVYQIILSDDGNSYELKTLLYDGQPIIDDAPECQASATGAVSLADGIMFSGRVSADAEGNVTADTFTGSYGDIHFSPAGGMVSLTPVYSLCSTAYMGRYYVLGVTVSEEGGYVFAGTDVQTKPQYGDAVRISVSSSGGGTVSREGTSIGLEETAERSVESITESYESYVGANEAFMLIPEEGYRVAAVRIDGQELSEEEVLAAAKDGIALEDITADHEIYVEFVKE